MIRASDGKLGTRELCSIVYLLLGIRVTDMTPNLLLDVGITATWMMPLFSTLFMLIPFLLMLSLFKKHETGLLELSCKLAGTFGGTLITILLFLPIFFSAVINSRSYADIVQTMYYPNTAIFIILFFLLATSLFIANRGLETIGSTAWLVSPGILVSSLFLLVFTYKDMDPGYIFPIAGPGMGKLVKSSMGYSSFFADVIFIALFFSYVRNYESFKKATLLGFGISSLKMVLYVGAYIMTFDYPSIQNIAYPYHHLTRLAAIGEVASHIEAFFLGLWFMGASIHFGIYLYTSAFLLGRLIRFGKFERLLIPLAGLAILLGLLPDNVSQGFDARIFLLQSSSILFFAFPVFLWGIDRFKGRKKT